MTEERRPAIDALRSGDELLRWYWLKSELIALARARGVSASGRKLDLMSRLVAHLNGAPAPTAPTAPTRHPQLTGPLTRASVIPRGQRSSQALRAFFTAELGPSFRFDGPMRDFIAGGAGRTLGDAIDHWRATRDRPREPIAPQFELNRFLRAWHEEHPNGRRSEALAAWRAHRALPVDRR